MKALLYTAEHTMEYTDIEDVTPKPGEVKLRVRACGICGSDIHGYQGLTGRRLPPMVMGHEFSGEIAECGKNAAHYHPGCAVAVFPFDYCGDCDMCTKGEYQLCRHKRAFGVMHINGAMAEYICVPEKSCVPLAASVPYEVGSLAEPLAVAIHAVRLAGDINGKNVLVSGAGPIGLLLTVYAKWQGAKRVLVLNRSDKRFSIAKELGADLTLNTSHGSLEEEICQVTDGRGIDISFEATGFPSAVNAALTYLKFGGISVWVGNGQPKIEVWVKDIVTRALTVKGSFLYSYTEFQESVELINSGQLKVAPLISLAAPLREGPELFEKMSNRSFDYLRVILKP